MNEKINLAFAGDKDLCYFKTSNNSPMLSSVFALFLTESIYILTEE